MEYPYFLHKIWWVMHFMIIFAGIDEKTRNLKICLDVCKSTIYPPPATRLWLTETDVSRLPEGYWEIETDNPTRNILNRQQTSS